MQNGKVTVTQERESKQQGNLSCSIADGIYPKLIRKKRSLGLKKETANGGEKGQVGEKTGSPGERDTDSHQRGIPLSTVTPAEKEGLREYSD